MSLIKKIVLLLVGLGFFAGIGWWITSVISWYENQTDLVNIQTETKVQEWLISKGKTVSSLRNCRGGPEIVSCIITQTPLGEPMTISCDETYCWRSR